MNTISQAPIRRVRYPHCTALLAGASIGTGVAVLLLGLAKVNAWTIAAGLSTIYCGVVAFRAALNELDRLMIKRENR